MLHRVKRLSDVSVIVATDIDTSNSDESNVGSHCERGIRGITSGIKGALALINFYKKL